MQPMFPILRNGVVGNPSQRAKLNLQARLRRYIEMRWVLCNMKWQMVSGRCLPRSRGASEGSVARVR